MIEKHTLQAVAAGAVGALLVEALTLAALNGAFGLPPVLSLTSPSASVQPAELNANDESASIVSMVDRANPAVVSVVITKDVPVMEQYYEDNPFGNMFGMPFQFRIPQYRQNGTEKKEVGGGSGFIISDDGYIVTNSHVVSDPAAEYTVFLTDGSSYQAEIIASDDILDVALLKIEATALSYLSFGDSDQLKLGQTVVAIGYALGEFRNTVSSGVVSGLSRSIDAGNGYDSIEHLEGIIQTDAAINPGNSGGPLLALDGSVVGINVAVASGSAQNVGFALPANLVKSAIESMRENGKVVRAYLGVRYIPIDDALKQKNSLTVDYGVLVVRGADSTELAVIPGSPADKAGIVENDIILEVDGQKLDADHSLANAIREKQPGDTIQLNMLHRGEEKTMSVVLEQQPE
jgi:serine protease Do